MLAIVTLGELLDDVQLQRVAAGNRIHAMQTAIGGTFPALDEILADLERAEERAAKELTRMWKKHPLAPWAKTVKGAGELSVARLVALVGDPAERPNVAKLWQYCGHGDPERSRPRSGASQQDVLACGKPRAKKQVWLIATALVKRQCPTCAAEGARVDSKKNGGEKDLVRDWSPHGCTCADLGMKYRAIYNQTRTKYQTKLHERACLRCGPSGRPAQPGSPWSAAHQHAAALRKVGKEFLKELWVSARADQDGREPHR